jgi:D-tyrosyl-tRNA(Tyr) deacylase
VKVVLQRVKKAQVRVRGKVTGGIERGLCLLVGVEKGDTKKDALYLADKISGLRIFPDSKGKMNLSLQETGGKILAVSQFTLAGSVRKGRRPGFDRAEKPEQAEELFDYFVAQLREKSIQTETGIFGEVMDIYLVNDGPVTFIISS